MDLFLLIVLVVGTNIVTFFVVQWHFYSNLKHSRLLPVYLAWESGALRKMKLSVDVADWYLPEFEADLVKSNRLKDGVVWVKGNE